MPVPIDQPPAKGDFGAAYELHAQAHDHDAVGGGDYSIFGWIELELLRQAGLRPGMTLLDFGCGTGRLALHAVPFLGEAGRYIGTDIAPTFIEGARRQLAALDQAGAAVALHVQPDTVFPVDDASVDVVCAFSVFTHMEHEDLFRYLRSLQRVLVPGGVIVLSLLPLDTGLGEEVFLAECELEPEVRWGRVRNFATSRDLATAIAALAGWDVVTWKPGDQPQGTNDQGENWTLGQTVAVLRRTAEAS